MSDFNFATLQEVAKESGFAPLDPSWYDVVIDKAEATKSGTGNKMIKVTFKVTTGPQANKGTCLNNFNIIPDNGKSLFFFFKHMKILGLDDAYFQGNPSTEQVARDLIGRRCRIKVGHRDWDGQVVNQVEKIEGPASGAPQSPVNNAGGPGVPDLSAAAPASNGVGSGSEVPQVQEERSRETVSVSPAPVTATDMPPAPF